MTMDVKMVGEVLRAVSPTREDAWLAMWVAAMRAGGTFDVATRVADKGLADFDTRFPPDDVFPTDNSPDWKAIADGHARQLTELSRQTNATIRELEGGTKLLQGQLEDANAKIAALVAAAKSSTGVR